MDRLKTMEAFVAVIKCGSFAGAAQQLGLSRPIVTNYVRALEKRLGVRLINRTTRRLSLTEVGQEYHDLCTKVLLEIETGEQSVTKLQTEPQGSLRILAPKSFGGLHLGVAVGHFAKAHPEINTSLILDDRTSRTFEFVENQFDVAVRLSVIPSSTMVAKKIGSLKWVVCASPAYLKANREPQSPKDLKDANCLLHRSHAPDRLWRFRNGAKSLSVKINGNFSSNSVLVLRDAASAGVGIALLPTYCLGDALKKGDLKRILAKHKIPEKPLYVLFPSSKSMPKKVRTFVDFLAVWYRDPQRMANNEF